MAARGGAGVNEARPSAFADGGEAQNTFERQVRPVLETMLAVGFVIAALAAVLLPVRVEDDAMAPTLNRGEWVLVSRLPYSLSDPRRGEVVAVAPREPTGTVRLGRVIGLPGESLQIRASQVLVNRRLLEEPYLAGAPALAQEADTTEYRLGRGRYVVLNDNRARRDDSRSRGEVERSAILGRAWLVIWPPERLSAVPAP